MPGNRHDLRGKMKKNLIFFRQGVDIYRFFCYIFLSCKTKFTNDTSFAEHIRDIPGD
jgi:hypothetical protein